MKSFQQRDLRTFVGLFLVFFLFSSPVLSDQSGDGKATNPDSPFKQETLEWDAIHQAENGDVKALTTLKAKAEHGDLIAQKGLGNIYIHDGMAEIEVVKRNNAEAIKWYRMAAEQWDRDAQNNLFGIYQWGVDVPKDETEAYFWGRIFYSKGRIDRHVTSPELDQVRVTLTKEQIASVEKRVADWIHMHPYTIREPDLEVVTPFAKPK